MGDGTQQTPARIVGDRVVLDVDLDVGIGANVVGPADARVQVSPARALEILDGLADLRSELRRLAEANGQAELLRAAMELVIGEPCLAGWAMFQQRYLGAAGGDCIEVYYVDPQPLRTYAELHGLTVEERSTARADGISVRVETPAGLVVLDCQTDYRPDGRPEPETDTAPAGEPEDACVDATAAAEQATEPGLMSS